ncbi:glycosyltransferase family 39 protein [Candidatus Daviesbacteria bacterium]|nr:glycosyltransferase family 39 protein [Candidatus Daviesbacteria bacterium]
MQKITKLAKNNLGVFFLAVFLIVHALVLQRMIFFPYPEFFIYPYLTNSGLKPYSQILDQHFPGLMFLPINFDNLGMHTENQARLWLLGLVMLTHVLLFIVSSKVFKSRTKALFVNFLYLVWQPFFEGWVFWIDNFIPLFTLSSFYFTYKYINENPAKKYLVLGGLALGIGVVFKQTVIPLSGLLFLYLLWQTRSIKNATYYLVGLLIPTGLMAAYYVKQNTFYEFWYWTIIFNLTVYSKIGLHVDRPLGYFTRVGLVFGSSVFALLSKKKREVGLLMVFLLGSLFGAFDRLDFVHLQPALPFAIIATAMGFEAIFKRKLINVFIMLYCFVTVWWLGVFYKGHISDRVLFFDSQTKTISEIVKKNIKPKERIFVFGAAPHLYQMSNSLPAGDIFVFPFPWFTIVSEDRILEGLKKDTPNIVVYDSSPKFNNLKITKYMSKINEYILKNYRPAESVGSVQIMKKI